MQIRNTYWDSDTLRKQKQNIAHQCPIYTNVYGEILSCISLLKYIMQRVPLRSPEDIVLSQHLAVDVLSNLVEVPLPFVTSQGASIFGQDTCSLLLENMSRVNMS